MALQDKLQNETKEGRKHKRTTFTLLLDFTTDKLTLKLLYTVFIMACRAANVFIADITKGM